MSTFKGFSTVGKKKGPFKLRDNELIKRDLLNELNTIRGERMMNVRHGSIIKNMLMEPLDETTESDIIDNITEIINNDPRVDLLDMNLQADDQTIRVDVDIMIKPAMTPDRLIAVFDREDN